MNFLQVKKCLVALIEHHLVCFETNKCTVYTINIENVHLRARYPCYIHATKMLFGDTGELICEDLLQQGQSLMSQVRAMNRL